MNMSAREIKWAVTGFVGGFLLCYLLLGSFRAEPRAPSLVTWATPSTPPLRAPATGDRPGNARVDVVILREVTNTPLPQRDLRPDRWDRWVGPRLPTDPSQRADSLDLLDTRHQIPPLRESP
jgi:hypothetical protein